MYFKYRQTHAAPTVKAKAVITIPKNGAKEGDMIVWADQGTVTFMPNRPEITREGMKLTVKKENLAIILLRSSLDR